MRVIPWLLLPVALVAVPLPALALPTLSSSLEDWGDVSIYGPKVTTSGGARTDIVGQRTEWDHDSSGGFVPGIDGELEQNVWTEASVVGGAPMFRSYHSLKGSLIPLHNGQGWTGFSTHAVYRDTWTLTMVGGPPSLKPTFDFGIHSRIGTLFPPGGSVAVGSDYYPTNPFWGPVPPGVVVVGPLPSTPPISLGLIVDGFRWYDFENTPANATALVSMGSTSHNGPLTIGNGAPFDVEIRFDAGWKMEHAEIRSILGAAFERFSTNRVLDVGETGVLAGVSVTDINGLSLQGWSLVDSQGTTITPIASAVPEVPTSMLIAAGGLVLLALTRWQRRRD